MKGPHWLRPSVHSSTSRGRGRHWARRRWWDTPIFGVWLLLAWGGHPAPSCLSHVCRFLRPRNAPGTLPQVPPSAPQHPASVSPHDSPTSLVQLRELLRPWVLRCRAASQHPKWQRPPWCPVGDGVHQPTPRTHPQPPAHLGSPVRLCGTQPRTRTCTPSPRRAGSAPSPRMRACRRGTGSPGDSRHRLRARGGVSGGEKAWETRGAGNDHSHLYLTS